MWYFFAILWFYHVVNTCSHIIFGHWAATAITVIPNHSLQNFMMYYTWSIFLWVHAIFHFCFETLIMEFLWCFKQTQNNSKIAYQRYDKCYQLQKITNWYFVRGFRVFKSSNKLLRVIAFRKGWITVCFPYLCLGLTQPTSS